MGEAMAVRSALVGALFDAWDELDAVLDGVSAGDMIEPWGGGSAFAWTYGHVANAIDAWLNVRFQGLAPHPVIGDGDLRFGGSGRATDWAAIRRGVAEVRAACRGYLQGLAEADWTRPSAALPSDRRWPGSASASSTPTAQHRASMSNAALSPMAVASCWGTAPSERASGSSWTTIPASPSRKTCAEARLKVAS